MASFLYLFTIGAIKLSCFDGLNKKNYQIHLPRLCALSSQKYFLHMTWPLRKKTLIHSGMSGNDFCDVGNENRNGEFLSRGWGTLRDEKKRSQLRERQGNEKKHRYYHSREWEQEWREQKRMIWLYKKIFRNIWREIKFCHQIFWNTPSSFLTTPPFSEATGIPAHPCIHFVRVVTSYVVNKARMY